VQVDTVLHHHDSYLARLVRTATFVEHGTLLLACYAHQDIIACRGQFLLKSMSVLSVIFAWSEQSIHSNIHVLLDFSMER